ncbi:MAG TPA: hypothetical protein VH084_13785 [Mycobacterium sp.]|nr:hypothetical protein [Mycobacterium sp.]
MMEQRASPHECTGRCGEDLHVDDFLEPSGFLAGNQRDLINHYAPPYIAQGWQVIAVEAAPWLTRNSNTDAVTVVFLEANPSSFVNRLFS